MLKYFPHVTLAVGDMDNVQQFIGKEDMEKGITGNGGLDNNLSMAQMFKTMSDVLDHPPPPLLSF